MTGPVRPFPGAPGGIPGQNGQQQQPAPHPTIGSLGLLPGGAQPVQQQNHQMQQMQQADPRQTLPQGLPQLQIPQQQPVVPQPQQQPQYQYPTQPQGQQPQYQQPPAPQSPQFQTPQGQRFELPDNAILDGPSVPPELRGRTWAQARQIYTALAGQFLAGRQAPQQPEPQQQPQQPQPPAPSFGRPRPQADQPQGSSFWSDPEGTIARVVDQRVQQAVAPMAQRSAQQAAEDAMRVAASGIRDFQQLYPEIIQVITESGARPEHLGNPNVWQSAADLARGRMAGRGQYNPSVVPAPQQDVRGPGAYVPAQVAPPVGQFFSEAPTPPQQPFGAAPNQSLTPDEEFYRQQMGVSVPEYIAWRSTLRVQR